MLFRVAQFNDISTLNTIALASKQHWGYPDEWIRHWLDDLTLTEADIAGKNSLVAELDGKTIGFCLIAESDEVYEIDHLWLLPEFIGSGYGKRLLGEAIKQFVNGDKPVMVEVDPNAEAFYRKQGFETVGQAESYPKGRFIPLMMKRF